MERKDKARLSGKSQLIENDHELSTLDLGTMEFMKWLMEENRESRDCLIVVKDFFENKYVILYDKCIRQSVIVGYREGMPWCMTCNADDCGHVGFAICLKQHFDRNDHIIY
ncbi:hypothetical protein [Candidatus Nitrosocosmicus franklandus]|uniref:Uncharacterized protein n=1 Tax=Candidatus Nitrosocosmicus franklandianus TaxID=1798806 RepID=A0A484IEH1_9ARCH|nr:hypothetical protein [Candidatus Nitrosocosmicus franklandus]VFJ14539.1 conserved protein of unknown function [Candidatus Nitrosocosmicus franklandus]